MMNKEPDRRAVLQLPTYGTVLIVTDQLLLSSTWPLEAPRKKAPAAQRPCCPGGSGYSRGGPSCGRPAPERWFPHDRLRSVSQSRVRSSAKATAVASGMVVVPPKTTAVSSGLVAFRPVTAWEAAGLSWPGVVSAADRSAAPWRWSRPVGYYDWASRAQVSEASIARASAEGVPGSAWYITTTREAVPMTANFSRCSTSSPTTGWCTMPVGDPLALTSWRAHS